jgi:hypothetical protein
MADHQRETTGSGQLTPVLRLMAGAGAGIVAMSATYPLDMVRGRLTVQEGRNVQYSGIVHAARTILREVSACGLRLLQLMQQIRHIELAASQWFVHGVGGRSEYLCGGCFRGTITAYHSS